MKKVAIVGAGIVGATAAYYLSKEADIEVTVFDHGQRTSYQGSGRNHQSLVL